LSYPSLLSVLFFSVCIISMVIGILVLQNDRKSPKNLCFFVLVITINFWSLGLALANIAPNAETVEIWRRVSALGWGTVYAVLLHFFLIITGKNNLLNKWWFYLLLYLPAGICVLGFAAPSGLNPTPYHLYRTEFGWVNVSGKTGSNIWDFFFYAYYIGYVITGLVLILLWGKRSSEYNIKMQSRTILFSFAAALVLASMTDVVLGNLFGKLPQMAPAFLLIPLVAIYHTITKHSFIVSEPVEKKANYLRIIVGVTLYVIFAFLQINLSAGTLVILSGSVDTATLKGIITQLQMLIAIYLVLKENKSGYFAALLLNTGSLLSSIFFMIQQGSTEPLPGAIFYLGVMLIIILIASYKNQVNANIEKIENQRKSLEESEKKLFQMIYFDSLTGLHNREWFMDYLSRSIHLAKRKLSLIGVIFVDLDSFKSINDTMGHSSGDEVLRIMAGRINSCLREEDAVARFGGDEFLIMVSNITRLEDLNKITDRIMESLRKPIILEIAEYFVSASVGVAVYPEDGVDSETLIKNADMAMYLAKSKGKNQCIYCTSDIKKETIKKVDLTNRLYRALEKHELSLFYQPQVDAKTEEIIGFEALLRWNNKECGNVSPAIFVPMAEQTGLIKPIGLWVFKTACEHLRLFQDISNKNLSMSINLSLEQLREAKFTDRINSIVKETGIEANSVQVEITESIAFNEQAFILQQLEDITNLGISIAIDDFGTGFSSFTRIKSFPIDLLKIDIDFVRGISSGSQKDMAIIKSTIHIAENLGIEVLAEGVEKEDQYIYLRDNGCDFIQGFYFYKPMTSEEVITLLKSKT